VSVKDDQVKVKYLTTTNVSTSVPATPMDRLGRVSKDNIVDEIVRVVLCIYEVKKGIYSLRLIRGSSANILLVIYCHVKIVYDSCIHFVL